MTDVKQVDSKGVYTVEGNLAGARAAFLTKEREAQRAEYEAKKNQIKRDNSSLSSMSGKFVTVQQTDDDFTGLMTYEDAIAKNNNRIKDENIYGIRKADKEKKKRKPVLSFEDDDVNVDEGNLFKKLTKDPHVITDFLPDQNIQLERERLKKEWTEQQEIIKKELLEVVYSYWDGQGHRYSLHLEKGSTIGKFLESVKQKLSSEYKELRGISSDNLIYVKEDLIIPHHYTFYDLIITKARGKSGPLFHFDVHDDVRLINDVRIEKDESHPGKVIERRWFERNKHIFPYSRYEIYDHSKNRTADMKYTIHGSS